MQGIKKCVYDGLEYDMILRDMLARDRTILANERTLLAYVRTAVGSFGAGVALLKFIEMRWVRIVGLCLMVAAPFFLAFGILRYVVVHRRLGSVEKDK